MQQSLQPGEDATQIVADSGEDVARQLNERPRETLLMLKQFIRPSGAVCTTTLHILKFRVSVERSCLFTHANCLCERQGSRRITMTRIITDID